jgi:hypothetical protein
MTVELPRLLLAGFLGALATKALGWGLLPVLSGWRKVSLGHLAATKLVGFYSDRRTMLTTLTHFVTSLLLALVYGIAFHPLVSGAPWLVGASFGVLIWLVVMLVVMPIHGEGFFGRRVGAWLAPTSLIVRVVYGVILGAVYR